MIEGLSHMTFIVKDLDRTEAFLSSVLDARRIYDSGDETFSLSKERFFDIAGLWVATMQGDPLPSKTYNHIAFKIPPEDYDRRLAKVEALQLDILESRSRVDGEGLSLYFYDYDNHLFELHTGTLSERLARYTQ